jgi:hypothetical protein
MKTGIGKGTDRQVQNVLYRTLKFKKAGWL